MSLLFSKEGDEGARGVDAEGEEAEGDRSVFSVGPATNRTLVYGRARGVVSYIRTYIVAYTYTRARDACRARCGAPRARGKMKPKGGQRERERDA